MSRLRIMIVDDHAMFREGLRAVLDRQADLEVVGEAGDAEATLEVAQEVQPDLVLMDLHLPQRSGVDAIRDLVRWKPELKVIVLTMFRDQELMSAALLAGAQGFVLKDGRVDGLIEAIRTVAAGGAAIDPSAAAQLVDQYRTLSAAKAAPYGETITARDVRILQLLAEGHSNREIGAHLFLSEQTVKNALTVLYDKLQVGNRTEAVAVALQRRLIHGRA
jgi:two-component system, NarL family, response regulator LiaR